MTPVAINTYYQDQKPVLEISWYDQKIRRSANIRIGMDAESINDAITKLQQLKENL